MCERLQYHMYIPHNVLSLIREAKGAYALEVEARDGAPSARPNSGGQPNSVTKYIRIGIADKNDNPPYFDKNLYEAEVDENEDIQHTVLTVTANDKDECKFFHHFPDFFYFAVMTFFILFPHSYSHRKYVINRKYLLCGYILL